MFKVWPTVTAALRTLVQQRRGTGDDATSTADELAVNCIVLSVVLLFV